MLNYNMQSPLKAIKTSMIKQRNDKITKYVVICEKVVIYHPFCHSLEIWKLLVILVVITLYAQIDICILILNIILA